MALTVNLKVDGHRFTPAKCLWTAVTSQFVPHRPDLHELVEEKASPRGASALPEFVGDRHAGVGRCAGGGDVWQGERWHLYRQRAHRSCVAPKLARSLIVAFVYERGVSQLPDLSIFCRGLHPSAILDVTLAGVNIPVRIGEVTVLPGDIILGDYTGVTFIPAHLALQVVEDSENIRA